MRGFLVSVAAVAACTPEAGLPDADPQDAEAFLVDDIAEVRERARMAFDGGATLLPDGDPLEGDPAPYLAGTEMVVVDTVPSPRISWQDDDVQLLLYPHPDDLAWSTWQRAWGVGDPRAPHDDGGVSLPAGADIEVLDARDGHRLVAASTPDLAVQAWVPDRHIDRWWVSDDAALPGLPEDARWVGMLQASGVIVDRPGGTPIAWPTEARDDGVSWVAPRAVGPEERGHLPVIVQDDGIEVRGWVHVDDLATDSMHGRGTASCVCGMRVGRLRHDPNVPAETRLHAAPDGPVVGRVRRAVSVAGRPEAGWVPYEIHTPWGRAITWLTLE